MSHWTYFLENPSGRFYVGQTNNLEARLANHNRTDKSARKFTRKNGPWTLVWSESLPNRASAMRREKEIKSWKSSLMIRTQLLAPPQ